MHHCIQTVIINFHILSRRCDLKPEDEETNDNAVSHEFVNNAQCLAVNSMLKLQSTKQTTYFSSLSRTQSAIWQIWLIDGPCNRPVISVVEIRSSTFFNPHLFVLRLAAAQRHLSTSATTQSRVEPASRSSGWAKRSRTRAAERILHWSTSSSAAVEKLEATFGLTSPWRRQSAASIRRCCRRWCRHRNRRLVRIRCRTSSDSSWTPLRSWKFKKRISRWCTFMEPSEDLIRISEEFTFSAVPRVSDAVNATNI